MPSVPSDRGLTVAVTGPTGGIGLALLRALDRARGIAEVRGMARRPFDPAARGLRRIVYQQGDVLDRGAVNRLVEGADVVVHLAFIIFGGLQESREVNLTGSRNVFEATIAAGAARLAYASSVAAYGFGEQGALSPRIFPRAAPMRITTRRRRRSWKGCWAACSRPDGPRPTSFGRASWGARTRCCWWRTSRT